MARETKAKTKPRTFKVWIPADFVTANRSYIALWARRKPALKPDWLPATLTLLPPPKPARKRK